MLQSNKILKEDIEEIISRIKVESKRLKNSRILVTGASGMLAKYIVFTLIELNKSILNNSLTIYLLSRHECSSIYGSDKNIKYLIQDVSEPLPNIKKLDFIIHAASKAAPKIYLANKIDTLKTNILGLFNILDLVTEDTKSILYFSSGEVYGLINSSGKIKEDKICYTDHLSDRSSYAEAKKTCETICMNYYNEKTFPINIVRLFHTFGPGLNIEDGRVFSDFIKDAIHGKDIVIKGDPDLVRPLLYIKDATIMFFKILLSKKSGEIYNIANPKNLITVKEMAKLTSEAVYQITKRKVSVVYTKENSRHYKGAEKIVKPDIKKFIGEFKYIPNTTAKKAFLRTIASYY
ncbi:MAG: NAD-dependent epimerase/dehydratase family protein [Patescibacteria group bacterium]|jgi:nucleoside-diphosphate-sugar epimerase